QDRDSDLQAAFKPIAKQLTDKEETIVAELNAVQGEPVDLGGYYRPDRTLAARIMRPSRTLNAVIDSL
ncbi:MAG: NADP-dependent isocitrate dehydrogenase, partial [Gammaproteobacteria bacterium]